MQIIPFWPLLSWGRFAALIGKTAGNLKAMWAQLVFSSKALSPKVVGSDTEVKSAVSGNKNAIGYIKAWKYS